MKTPLIAISLLSYIACTKPTPPNNQPNPITQDTTPLIPLPNTPIAPANNLTTTTSIQQYNIPILTDTIVLAPNQPYIIQYYEDAFMSGLTKNQSSTIDTLNGIILYEHAHYHLNWQKKHYKNIIAVPAMMSPYNKAYHIPNDSLKAWKDKLYILGNLVDNAQFDGALSSYITIMFKSNPNDYPAIIQKYHLQPNYSNSFADGRISQYNNTYFSTIETGLIKAKDIIKLSKQLAKEPSIDWVENHVESNEPVPLD